ncbi:MAG TPA: carboxymuconolactone decarboxylase family protein [Acidimicrobiia bacterium]|nr:carboxymuconolactone decarboxylase family protein [Acidimicrobiia bacterium]
MSRNAKADNRIIELDEATRAATRLPTEVGSLDDRTRALVVIAAAVCADSPTHTFTSLVTSAREAGVTEEEILGVLLTVGPVAGESRVVAVTPRVSKALGYDVERAMEYG